MSTLLEGHQRADLIRKLGKLGLGLVRSLSLLGWCALSGCMQPLK
jgi:hypothetical protein